MVLNVSIKPIRLYFRDNLEVKILRVINVIYSLLNVLLSKQIQINIDQPGTVSTFKYLMTLQWMC